MKITKTVTEKKLVANRQNAQQSTGPRTDIGKSNARFNAVTLGLFAKHVVVPMCDGDGSKVEFRRLVADLQQEFQPVGTRYLEATLHREARRAEASRHESRSLKVDKK